ncbi:NACHT, LRR and PYD domains-containing protein 3-like [Amblyraja radiata]|uniref:NACHT, LRR and PYD domains-containing protein 3-like n=1 Tax=Amblyraja radiata TaxID=386614 RepID=UPI00140383BF|nr:NACHT, LRR and PYD domains-containing protein 3-like [Amblyraja radiata]
MATGANAKKLTSIFLGLLDLPLASNTIVTRGIAGIGKSVLVQKLMYDWATGVALQDYDFIFMFSFYQLSLLSEEGMKITLPELVKQYCGQEESCESILTNESIRSMFIFDGMSDGELNLDFNKYIMCRDVNTPVTFTTLLTNLIKGELVPSATIWITTRPGTRNKIPRLHITRTTEIIGFQDQEKEKYFRMRCKEDGLAEKMIQVVKKQRSLFVMCTVPAFCSTLFSVLKAVLNSAGVDDVPQTLTEVYSKFLVHLIIYQQEKMKVAADDVPAQTLQKKQDSIIALGKLAFEKSSKDVNQTFNEEDFTRNNIDLAFICGGLCKEIKMDEGKPTYAFVHLAFQEYFAALYVFLAFYNQKKNPFGKTKDKKGCQEFFLRFLCGLGTKKNHEILKGLLADDKPKDDPKKIVVVLKKILQTNIPPKQTINIFHCLNELDDTSALEDTKAAFKSGTFTSGTLSPAQCSARLCGKARFDDLPPLQKSQEYRIGGNKLTSSCSNDLTSMITENKTLVELDLSNNRIGEEGLNQLCETLKNEDCKLQKLGLAKNSFTVQSCTELISSLKENQSLKELDLSFNNLEINGINSLCEVLSGTSCQINSLKVMNTKLTNVCCETLSSVLKANQTLTELDLSMNELGDDGLNKLFSNCSASNCKLQKLGRITKLLIRNLMAWDIQYRYLLLNDSSEKRAWPEQWRSLIIDATLLMQRLM